MGIFTLFFNCLNILYFDYISRINSPYLSAWVYTRKPFADIYLLLRYKHNFHVLCRNQFRIFTFKNNLVMKSFFINFWNVMIYSSFTLAGIFLLIFVPCLNIPFLSYNPEPKYDPAGSIPWHQSIEMIVKEIFDYLNIDFQPTSLQIFITLISFFLILGFISRAIVIRLEYSRYSE